MKVIICGGTGQIGDIIAREWYRRGWLVVVLARHWVKRPWPVIQWDGVHEDSWMDEMEGADVLINLAGRSVNCRYGPKERQEIRDSRIQSTLLLGRVLTQLKMPPRLWIQASTATIYAHRFDAPNDEFSGQIGGNEPGAPSTWNFSVQVAKAWEAATNQLPHPRTRKVCLRSAMMMSPDAGGVFDTLLRLVRFGLGGAAGTGRQYVSWIHERDFVNAVDWIIAEQSLSGPINLCSPNPLPNREFMKDLRDAWGIPFGLPASEWMLEIGARFLKTETELILKSRRVIPTRLINSGFKFSFPTWHEAASDLCRVWREKKTKSKQTNPKNY